MRLREDYRTMSGPEKAALLLMSVGDDNATRLFGLMDDDEIKELSQAMANLGTVSSQMVERLLVERFAAYGIHDLPAQVMRQADVPRGARVLDNPVGSAPGLAVEVDGTLLIALPGPPHELAATLSAELRARLGAS